MTATARRARPPTGSARVEDWAQHGACRNLPDLFTADHHAAAAIHLCTDHCPVLTQCAADRAATRRDRLIGVVQAGIAHNASGQPRTGPLGEVQCYRCQPTAPPADGVCVVCGLELPGQVASGRPRRYCSALCRDTRSHKRQVAA